MWWRLKRKEFEANGSKGNRGTFKRVVDSGEVTGILGYENEKPVGWCSVAPRERFGALERSPVLKRIDNEPVWSLVCLYVRKDRRGEGVSMDLIRGAIDHVRSQGGQIVEAYPHRRTGELEPVSSYMGTVELFISLGFELVATPSEAKAIVRYQVS